MRKHKGSKKHFSLRQRNYLEVAILRHESVIKIANYLGFSRQSIYREIKINSYIKNRKYHDLETAKIFNNKLTPTCPKLMRFPFVCNTCEKKQSCSMAKRYYHADYADDYARRKLRNKRKGTRLTHEQRRELDHFLLPLMQKGQSLHHIYVSNPCRFTVTERTLRNLINRGELSIRNYHLPMTVRFAPKKKYRPQKPHVRLPEVLLNRTDRKSVV